MFGLPFTFAEPLWFLLLPALLPLLLLFRRTGSPSSITFSSLKFLVSLGATPRTTRGKFTSSLLISALICGIFALARPQKLNYLSYSTASGVDIMLALDVSGSMTNIKDMGRNGRSVNRLEVASNLAAKFIEKRPSDRIGLVIFAPFPLLKSPPTLQHDWLQNTLLSLDNTSIDNNGTAIGSAIATAATRLEDRPDTKSKIIILITDGANNAGALDPLDAAQLAAKLDIKIYTIAIGTPDGRLPGDIPRREEFDPAVLKEIASLSGGEAFLTQRPEELEAAFSSIDQLEKTEAARRELPIPTELFQLPLALSLIFALCSLGLPLVRPNPAPN